jgi:hypothetical protein
MFFKKRQILGLKHLPGSGRRCDLEGIPKVQIKSGLLHEMFYTNRGFENQTFWEETSFPYFVNNVELTFLFFPSRERVVFTES